MKKTISLLFKILTRAEQTQLFVLSLFDLLIGVADIIFLIIMLLIIQFYTGSKPEAVTSPVYYKIFTVANPVWVTGFFLLLFSIKSIIGVWISKSQHRFVFAVSSRLSDKNITNYLKGSYTDFVNVDSSQRIRTISQVPIEFSSYILTNVQLIIAQGILIMLTVAAILIYHPVLFVLLLALLLPPVILLGWFVKQQLKKARNQIKTNSVKVIQYLQEALAGYVESNVYDGYRFFAGRYNNYQQQMNGNIATLQTWQGVSSRFFEVFALLGFFILIVINKLYAGKSTVNLLTIGVFMAAAYKIIPGMVKILNSSGQIKTYNFILDDLTVDTAIEIATPVIQSHPIASIKFDNIYFKYKERVIIDGLSFEIQPGDLTGLSGVSGRGKTTAVNLLLGFLQQDTGRILINGKDAAMAERKAYWPGIAYVKQQNFFINDTILKNITLTDDNCDNELLNQALAISGLDTFLTDQPDGINKLILEHGKNISGGQRQRIALARALYRNFDLLILDEPFSEMDYDAEQEILQSLKRLTDSGKMILLITHNKASLTFCNKIITPYALQA